MSGLGDDSSDSLAIGLVLFFFVFVGFGILFVGGDDGDSPGVGGSADSIGDRDPQAPNQQGTEDSNRGVGDREGEKTETVVRVPVATDSPVIEPYEPEANYSDPDFSDLNVTRTERLVVEHTNRLRKNRSLGGVTFSESLSEPAREHSVNMSESEYLGHIDPAGKSPRSRYIDECDGLRDRREEFEYSENVAFVWYKSVFNSSLTGESVYVRSEEGVADLLVDEWMASERHRRNILDPKWETLGVGIEVDEDGTVFGTQAFCSVGG